MGIYSGIVQLLAGFYKPPSIFVRKIVEQVKHAGVNPSLILLDREFYSTDVIRTLDSMGVRCLIPGINTGPVKKAPGTPCLHRIQKGLKDEHLQP